MTIVFVAMDEKVATWRTVWPARELRRRGYETCVYGVQTEPQPLIEPTGDLTYVLHVINKAWSVDGRIITHMDTADWMRSQGRLVLSFDDDWTRMLDVQIGQIDPVGRRVHREIPKLVKRADKVVVATPRLAEVFGQWAREVHVAENCIPEWVLTLPQADRLERVLWQGEMFLHGADWRMLKPYARDLPPLYLIGPQMAAAAVMQRWGVRDVVTTMGATVNQRKLYREMGRGVAAIIPLRDTAFNRGKSWCKALEFMARGVPIVASKHAEYDRLNEMTGAVPTYEDPAALVEAVNDAWENRRDASDGPDRIRAAGLTMEQQGGDAWEKALA